MGKRSSFERRERDFYPTPPEAVVPLLSHLPKQFDFWEPCAGNGALVGHIEGAHRGAWCCRASDIEPQHEHVWGLNALSAIPLDSAGADLIITNPPWSRDILHPMIIRFSDMLPTWLLFDADWVHTKQAIPYLPRLRKVVSVGRVKWIPDSKMTGKDNCAWHLFSPPSGRPTEFFGRQA